MLTSALLIFTLMPLQASPSNIEGVRLNTSLAVAAVVDSAKILGLPRMKLRDSGGNRYYADNILKQEPTAMVYQQAGLPLYDRLGSRQVFIQNYVRR